MSLTITYIYHDGFLIQSPEAAVVIDFWKDPDNPTPSFLSGINARKRVYVLVSHHHKDHFNPEIFQWSARFPDIRYIISRDTYRSARHYIVPGSLYNGPRRVNPDSVITLAPGEDWSDNLIDVRAFGSTDTGNSYLFSFAGKTFFHAGDLNAWIWKDESTQEEVDKAIADFNRILDSIAAVTTQIDVAMFPVDPRLGTDFYLGAKIFLSRFRVKLFIPMHFTLAEDAAQQLEYITSATNFVPYCNPDFGRCRALTIPDTSLTIV